MELGRFATSHDDVATSHDDVGSGLAFGSEYRGGEAASPLPWATGEAAGRSPALVMSAS